jgi:hypothetical protein
MTARDLLAALQEHGVELMAAGDRLRYRAPKGVLTNELRQMMREYKTALLQILRPEVPIAKAPGQTPVDGMSKSTKQSALDIRWGREKGWLLLTDPLTGQTHEVPAKGCPRWVFADLRKHVEEGGP